MNEYVNFILLAIMNGAITVLKKFGALRTSFMRTNIITDIQI